MFVVSTFGNGDAPVDAERLQETLQHLSEAEAKRRGLRLFLLMVTSLPCNLMPKTYLRNMLFCILKCVSVYRYCVFALGSTAYPKFCNFGKHLDSALEALDAERMMNLGTGDELNRQEQSFQVSAERVTEASNKKRFLTCKADMAGIPG